MVAGLGDRALERKACVPRNRPTTDLTPRVIAFQNRMRLTQSPGRAAPQRAASVAQCRFASTLDQPTKTHIEYAQQGLIAPAI